MWPVVFPALTDVRLNTPRYALELDDHSFVAPRKRSVSPLDLETMAVFQNPTSCLTLPRQHFG